MEVMETRPNDDIASKMGRIMLRYRPIAPKPSAACAARGVPVETTQAVGLAMKREEARRKGSSGGGKRGRKSRKTIRDPSSSVCAVPVVTLPLMPVTSERKVWSITRASPFSWPVLPVAGVVASPRQARASTVLVTVECVTKVWSVGIWGSNTSHDYELRRWLESDDCPAFVSSAEERVTWTNASYRRMVVGEFVSTESPSSSSSSHCSTSWSDPAALSEGSVEEEARVVLVTRGLVPGNTCRAFTCMTSVRYACGSGAKVSLAVPCDVWRLEDGTLAWRLDVKAALSLSTGN